MSEHLHEEHVSPAAELVQEIAGLHMAIAELAAATERGSSRVQDVDLTAANPAPANDQAQSHYDEAVQVDNPYAVTLELRASSDGGGPVLMRVPAHSSRVLTVKARELSLHAIGGNPAGAIPATVVRFDRPQPAGLYPYAP